MTCISVLFVVAAGSCRCNVGMYSSFPHGKFQLVSRWLIRLFSDLESESRALKVICKHFHRRFLNNFLPVNSEKD